MTGLQTMAASAKARLMNVAIKRGVVFDRAVGPYGMGRLLKLALLGLAFATALSAAPAGAVYLDPKQPVDTRVEDLLARMTPREKLQQLTAHWLPGLKAGETPEGVFSDEWFAKEIPDGVGTVGPSEYEIPDEIRVQRRIREFLRTRTRLGIPTFFHDEASHGIMKPGATSFPMPIGLACSWNEELIERIYDRTAREARSRGTHHVLSPVVDVSLDPRWGRTEETLGEDPWLNGRLGTAMVRGLQGGRSGEVGDGHVMATLKHLVGHGAPEGGLNRSATHVGPVELRETHLLPFAMIIRDARPATIMPCYNDIDGTPAHANKAMLIDCVRGELGFGGLYVSDYNGVSQMWVSHHVVDSAAAAARLALESGVQMELPIPETILELEPLLAKDRALAVLVDDAVRAVLRVKFRMGLFEEAVPEEAKAKALAEDPAARELALRAARESMVLLRNEGGFLPLREGAHRRIAVIGPNADIARLGGYSGTPRQTVSLVEGLRERLRGKAEVVNAEGCKLADQDARNASLNWRNIVDVKPADPELDRKLIAEAERLAQGADLVILALGENEVMCRESWDPRKLGDRASLELVGAQVELAERILALGKPTVLYLSNGRPISLGALRTRFPAIIEGWYAGQETGRAAAEILFGDVNPSGKLTISVPRSAGHLPVQYRRKTYSAAYTYLMDSHEPDYPFGFGLSYTTYTYGAPRVDKERLARGERVRVSVDVHNSGARDGTEIVQLYLRDEVSSVTRPALELRGFKRVALKAGEVATVSFELGEEELAMWNRKLERVVEPGWFTALVGPASDRTQAVRFEVVE